MVSPTHPTTAAAAAVCAGPYRAAFLAEAVADLRSALRAAGSELAVRVGRPEEVIGELVRRTGARGVYCHTEVGGGVRVGPGGRQAGGPSCVSWAPLQPALLVAGSFLAEKQPATARLPCNPASLALPACLQVTYEELRVEAAVKAAAEAGGAKLLTFWANTLCHPEDLPFKLSQLPQNFGGWPGGGGG
jgi:deoxyribodipyrimidine photolyase